MELFCLALRTEGGDPHDWLRREADRNWLTCGVWTLEEPPVTAVETIPCLVTKEVRDRLTLADAEDQPFGPWIIAEHKVDRLEQRHWRKLAFMSAPLPGGGVFPWEKVQFRVSTRVIHQLAGIVVRGDFTIEHDILIVGPEDACTLMMLHPEVAEWMGGADQSGR